MNTNSFWIRKTFSEPVFNFNKDYITPTNCDVNKVAGSGDKYSIKVTTLVPTDSASIAISTTDNITTGKGLEKTIEWYIN